MQKQLGKITPFQFRTFVDQLPMFQNMAKDLQKLMKETPEEKRNVPHTHDYSWAWAYKSPFPVHIAIAVSAMDL